MIKHLDAEHVRRKYEQQRSLEDIISRNKYLGRIYAVYFMPSICAPHHFACHTTTQKQSCAKGDPC